MLQGTSNRKVCGFTRRKRVWCKQQWRKAVHFFLYFCPDFSLFSFQGNTETEWKSFMIDDVEPITLTAAPTLVNICQIISFAESGHLSHEPIRCLQLHLRLKSSESSPWLLRAPWQSGFTTSEMARRDIFWSWWEMWHCEGWWPSLKRSSLYMSKILNQVRGFWISMPTFGQTLLAAKPLSCW